MHSGLFAFGELFNYWARKDSIPRRPTLSASVVGISAQFTVGTSLEACSYDFPNR
jgi:hypothetical protein